ncbi:MAG: Na(+)-translocating NADH-quinone reductase subunit A [Gammaproteobacteria bacterium]|nr:Na(+)-translocating NADH-quinone reductase subunit A [Gammaproteobacteria bacterium]
MIKIKKGLNIPLAGNPAQIVDDGNQCASVALLGADTPGLKPAMAVNEGDRVALGHVLYTDKRNPLVPFVSPGSGVVRAINRGEKRVLQSVVIELEGSDEKTFPVFDEGEIDGIDPAKLRQILVESGQWTAFRTRPFSRIPATDTVPNSVFVTAIDTNPLTANPAVAISQSPEAFSAGLRVIARLGQARTFICTAPGSNISCPELDSLVHAEFAGPHPAGLPGTHIHFLDPVSVARNVWHIAYQDVIAIGRLFLSGRIDVERIVALGGPVVDRPRLLRTRAGASIRDLLDGELSPAGRRIISGSVLAGHRATRNAAWLGRYHNQVSVVEEGSPREFLSWMRPGLSKFSFLRAFVGKGLARGDFNLTTTQNGSARAMVSTGSFERVMPLDILPTPLLKALLVRDTDSAQALGCLELDEEDLSLCSFVCNGKHEYGPHLRMALDEIEANG